MKKQRAIIIGGGPAGLTAAFDFLDKTDIQPIVLEQSDYWGAISRTVNYKGNRIDIGGHRFFSKSDVVMEWWSNILPIHTEQKDLTISYQNKPKKVNTKFSFDKQENVDNVMFVRSRLSRIYYHKIFFDYPISLTLGAIFKLGLINTGLIGISYMKSILFPIRKERNLEDFFINRFGNIPQVPIKAGFGA